MSDIIIPGVGSLQPVPALDHLDLLAPPVARALTALAERGVATASSALAVAIDPELADTEVMTREFGMDLALSSNCILVAGKRAGEERIAACVVRATTNADVNHVVKKRLDVSKASFWPQDRAVEASGMEYGGITPVGVPSSWRLLIDSACASGWSCIGSGLRRSKLFVTGEVLAALPHRFTRVSRGTRPGRGKVIAARLTLAREPPRPGSSARGRRQGQATHSDMPRPIGGRREACGAWPVHTARQVPPT